MWHSHSVKLAYGHTDVQLYCHTVVQIHSRKVSPRNRITDTVTLPHYCTVTQLTVNYLHTHTADQLWLENWKATHHFYNFLLVWKKWGSFFVFGGFRFSAQKVIDSFDRTRSSRVFFSLKKMKQFLSSFNIKNFAHIHSLSLSCTRTPTRTRHHTLTHSLLN